MLTLIDPELLKSEISLLIVTATDIELQEILAHLSPLPTQQEIATIYRGNLTYSIGVFGVYGVVLVQSEMGSVGANGSLVTALNAINLWEPKAVITVGIAFGIDDEKQRIGDVLISSHIIPYEFGKATSVGFQYRSPLPTANTLLVNRARAVRDWRFANNGRTAKVFLGPLLTGEKVIDDADFRDKLKNVYRNTIGGEMESAGIFAAANDTNTPWLIIKGICDFADGNKEKNKEMNQVLAIKASVSFALHFFSNRYAFNDLSFKPLVFYRSRPLATEPVKLSSVISFLDSYSQSEDKAPWQQLRVSAREITQTEGDKSLKDATTMVMQLVPGNTLRIFEDRIQSCWNDYNTVLASPDGYLPDEVERFTTALMRCICRELKRLITLNGGLPSNPMFAGWWNQYHCI